MGYQWNKGKVAKPVHNSKKPWISGKFGYDWAGPGNSMDAREPFLDGSEKAKTEHAAYEHDKAYHGMGKISYLDKNPADRKFEEDAGDDIAGKVGKWLFKLKDEVMPGPEALQTEKMVSKRPADDEDYAEQWAKRHHGNADEGIELSRGAEIGDLKMQQKLDEGIVVDGHKAEGPTPNMIQSADGTSTEATLSSMPAVGGMDVDGESGAGAAAGNAGSAQDHIPNHARSRTKSYRFSVTRGWFFTGSDGDISTSGSVTNIDNAPAGWPLGNSGTPIGTNPDWNGVVNMGGWKIIPNNNLRLYMSDADFQQMYSDNAYEYKVDYVRIKGYDAVMATALTNNANTVNQNIEKPLLFEYKDTQHLFQNQGRTTTANGTDLGQNEYTPNNRTLEHEDQNVPLGTYLGTDDLKYWIPGPSPNWGTDEKLLRDMVPQIERTGGLSLIKPGHDIAYSWTGGKVWQPMYSANGQAMCALSAGNQIDPAHTYFRGNYHNAPKMVSSSLPAGGVTGLHNEHVSPLPVWALRIHNYDLADSGALASKVYMLFDYEIQITVKCRDNHMFYRTNLNDWANGMPDNSAGIGITGTATAKQWYLNNLSSRSSERKFTNILDDTGSTVLSGESIIT